MVTKNTTAGHALDEKVKRGGIAAGTLLDFYVIYHQMRDIAIAHSGFSLHSDGGGHESLTLGYDGEERKLGDKYTVTRGKYGSLGMNGREVYKFATREVSNEMK